MILTGFAEVDNAAALIPLRRFRELWNLGPRAHGLTLRLKDPARAVETAGLLRASNPGLRFRPWQDFKKDFLEAIRFEKTMLFFLMFIITLVASFSIGSTLFSAVIRRSREVGVLASLGAARLQVVALFGLQGLLIGALGTFLGFVLTWTILAFRDAILSGINACFGDGDMMANIYQFSKVPLHYDASDFVIAGLHAPDHGHRRPGARALGRRSQTLGGHARCLTSSSRPAVSRRASLRRPARCRC